MVGCARLLWSMSPSNLHRNLIDVRAQPVVVWCCMLSVYFVYLFAMYGCPITPSPMTPSPSDADGNQVK